MNENDHNLITILFLLFAWFLVCVNVSNCVIYFLFKLFSPSVHVERVLSSVGRIIVHEEEPRTHMITVRTHPDISRLLEILRSHN